MSKYEAFNYRAKRKCYVLTNPSFDKEDDETPEYVYLNKGDCLTTYEELGAKSGYPKHLDRIDEPKVDQAKNQKSAESLNKETPKIVAAGADGLTRVDAEGARTAAKPRRKPAARVTSSE